MNIIRPRPSRKYSVTITSPKKPAEVTSLEHAVLGVLFGAGVFTTIVLMQWL